MLALLATPIGRWLASIAAGALLLLAAYLGFLWWLHEHDKEILAGYVAQSELDASEAKAAKLQRDIIIGEQIRAQADKAAEQLDIESQKRQAADEKAISENRGGSVVTDDDLHRIDRVRKSQ